jgi:hypothetical protein
MKKPTEQRQGYDLQLQKIRKEGCNLAVVKMVVGNRQNEGMERMKSSNPTNTIRKSATYINQRIDN